MLELVLNAAEDSELDEMSLLNGIIAVFDGIAELASGPGLAEDFKNEFPGQLLQYLLVEYALQRQPRVGYLLMALGIIRIDAIAATATRAAYWRRTFAFADLAELVTDPITYLKNAYRWGADDFRGDALVTVLARLFGAWGFTLDTHPLDTQTLAYLNNGAVQPAAAFVSALRLVLIQSTLYPVTFNAGVGLFVLPKTATEQPGLALLPSASAGFDESIQLTDRLSLGIHADVDLTGGLGVLMRPNRDIEFSTGLSGGVPLAVTGNLALSLHLANAAAPLLLFGTADATRLQALGFRTTAGTRFHSDGKYEIFTEAAVEGGNLVIKPDPNDADSFLSKLLPADGIDANFDLSVGYSTTRGVYFGGSGGLEVAIPTHIELGPIEILGLLLAVRLQLPEGNKPFALPVEVAATIKGDFAVLVAVVENVGVKAVFSFPADGKGNLGPLDLALKFRPPNGVGLSIDVGVVKGGGYLYLDPDKGEYAGALELTVSDFLSLHAIGLINTKIPGGGFSLLMIITAEFSPGYQLGYGFVLLGVGGLLGLNRVVLLDPLTQAVRSGTAANLLFPTDIVANAPAILNDLRAIFPPQTGVFLIGPMAKIGWGSPILVRIALGVIIEIPGDIVILGKLAVSLPTEEDPQVLLQVLFVGALEFSKRRLWFFATLFDSRVLFITLEGEMGLLMDFSDKPNFVLSIGGFHPRFAPPPLPFPIPRRLTLSIVDESNARIRADAYFAVTSNSVQLGCHAEAFFGFGSCSVTGYINFDALLRFSPFYFIVEVSAGFSLRIFGAGVFSVRLRGSLEGPSPWHIRGSAGVSFWFFSFDVDFDVTFGQARKELLPPIEVLPRMKTEFETMANWRATPPVSGRTFVSLRELGSPDLLVLHSVGTLQISQRFAPVNMTLDKVGNQKPSDVTRVSVTAPASTLEVKGPAQEPFAIAQYRESSDADKLSAPAFELLDSGVELGADAAWAAGPASTRNVRYESVIIDTPLQRGVRRRHVQFPPGLFVHFRGGAAVSRSEVSLAHERRTQPWADKIAVSADGFAIADQADNRAHGSDTTFGSHAAATSALADLITADPSLAESVYIIPAVELAGAR